MPPTPPPRSAASAAPAALELDLGTVEDDDADLPAPVAPPSLDLASPLDDLDLPTPAGSKPAATRRTGGLDVDSLDLPAPLEVDLPAPAGIDLPAPVDDLPMPASNLPAPASSLPAPKGAYSAAGAASSGSAPRYQPDAPTTEIELEDLPPEPEAPTTKPAAVAGSEPLPDFRAKPMDAGSEGAAGRAAPSRTLLYAGAGVGLLALVGVGLWMSGLLGGEAPPPPPPTAGTQPQPGSGGEAPLPVVPPGEAAERVEPVLAKLAEDSPNGYQQAQALAEQTGDVFGEAEAALLSHLRYGPNAEALAFAEAKLAGAEGRTEAYVKRVLGLAKLASGDAASALGLFDGQDARSRLYASWAHLKLGQIAEAKSAAQAAVAARPDDAAAGLEVATLEMLLDVTGGLAKLEAWVDAHPEHLAAHEALVGALLDMGQLAKASTRLETLPSTANTSADHQASVQLLRGRVLLAQGKTSASLKTFEQASAIAPSALAPKLARLETLLAAKDLVTTRRDVEVLLNERGQERDVLAFAAKADLAGGESDRALGRADALAALNADDPMVPWIRARVADIRGAFDDARSGYAAARDKDPGNLLPILSEVEMLRRQRLDADAIALLDAQLTSITNDDRNARRIRARMFVEKARIHAETGDVAKAKTALDEALAQDPFSNEALLARGWMLLRAGDFAGGEVDLRKLYEITGGYPGLASPLGRVLLRKGDLEALEKLIAGELGDELAAIDILLTGAALRVRQGKYDEAIKLAERVLARSSESWEAHLVKGQALLLSGDLDAGLMEMEQAKPKEPTAEVEMWMGQALEYNGKPKEAVARYKAALTIDPNLDEAAALYGRQLAYAGSAKEALAALQPVVERTDAFPYAWVAIGIARKDLGKIPDAIAAFQKAVDLDPKQFEALYWKGRLHHDRNEHAKAEDALAAAVDVATDGTPYLDDAYRRLGNSRWELGKKDGARTAYEKYLELAPPNAAGRAEVARRIGK